MGPVEEAGKVAGGIVDTLKNQPLAMALILINVIYLVAGGYIWHRQTEQRSELVTSIIKQCFEKPSSSSGMNSGIK